MEGRPPPSAIERHAKDRMRPASSQFKRKYPHHLLEIVDWSMEVDPLLRPQDAKTVLEALQSERGRPRQSAPPTGDSGLRILREQQS